MTRYIPSANKSSRANCPTECANFTAKIGRFPVNLQAALVGFNHSPLKQEVLDLFILLRVLKRIMIQGLNYKQVTSFRITFNDRYNTYNVYRNVNCHIHLIFVFEGILKSSVLLTKYDYFS